MATPHRRADAERSRSAIVAAYAELVAERGADVPMYAVGQRAGVGQATLYRHFPDRTALLASLFESTLAAFEHAVSIGGGRPELLFELLDEATLGQARFHSLSAALFAGDVHGVELRRLAERTIRVFRRPLDDAVAAGLARPELTPEDMVAVMSMMEGMLLGVESAEDREAAVRRGMRIILAGIRT